MSSLVPVSDKSENPSIIINIEYSSPIDVASLGRLFSSLADDYGRLNKGRTLTVSQLRQGSLIAVLQDAITALSPYAQTAAEIGGAAKSLKKLSDRVKDYIASGKEDPEKSDLFKGRRRPGVKSAESLLQIALETKGEVTFRCKTGDDQEVYIHVNSPEALRIREESRLAQLEATAAQENRPQIEAMKHKLMGSIASADLSKPSDIAASFAALAGPDGRLDKEGSDVAAQLISIFASILKNSGMESILDSVASDLDGRGLYQLAELVRSHMTSTSSSSTRLITRY